MREREIELQLKGYGLTTAHILYHLPDYPALLQTYVWQDYDMAPEFPAMYRFLEFWRDSLDGRLHSVRYAYKQLIGPGEWRSLDGDLLLN
jgi:uncharacterized protein Usg